MSTKNNSTSTESSCASTFELDNQVISYEVTSFDSAPELSDGDQEAIAGLASTGFVSGEIEYIDEDEQSHRCLWSLIPNGDSDCEYKCPRCQSTTSLEVNIRVSARLIQDGAEFQTEVGEATDNSHDWSDESYMCCTDCGKSGTASHFRG